MGCKTLTFCLAVLAVALVYCVPTSDAEQVIVEDSSQYLATFTGTKSSNNTFIACEYPGRQNTRTLFCPSGYFIKINSAYYGRQSDVECPGASADQMIKRDCVSSGSQEKIEKMCEGKQSCEIIPENWVFGDHCQGTWKYVKVEYDCVEDINECDTGDICGVGGTCENTVGSYECHCDEGYIGGGEATPCEDWDPCPEINASGMCGWGTCSNVPGSYECICDDGFIVGGVVQGFAPPCEDTNECDTTDICGIGGTCINTAGSYECTCDDGYIGGGEATPCTDINECDTTDICGIGGTCSNTDGSYECTCNAWYIGGGTATPCSGCNERLTGSKDSGYRGCQTVTRSGRTCQKWNSQSPHEHSRTPGKYPKSGLGDHNYCRNPDGEDTIWCYTTDKNERWEYCHPINSYAAKRRTICEGSSATVSCPVGKVINVSYGFYGRLSNGPCFAWNIWTNSCSAKTAQPTMRKLCNGKNQCTISAKNSVFGDPCPNTHKYAEIKYNCVEKV